MPEIEITPQLLAYLRDKAEEATPGPYHKDTEWKYSYLISSVDEEGGLGELAKVYSEEDADYFTAVTPDVVLALIEKIARLEEDFDTAASSAADESVKVVRLEKEADWLAARVKCDNSFTPEQEAACVRANGPCARCLREAAKRAVNGEGAGGLF